MIYVDASVVLAEVFGESRRPPSDFWDGPLVASRLTDLEVRTRANASEHSDRYRVAVDRLAGCISFTEISRPNVDFIYGGGVAGLRTLDAIHLATLAWFNGVPGSTTLATYDRRLASAAEAMGFDVVAP